MDKVIKLAVVEDDDFFKANIVKHLKPYKDIKIVIKASNGRQLIDAIKRVKSKPDVVLLDYEMPVMNGAETTHYLSANYPDIKILILTVHKDERISNLLIENGAHGFLLKENGLDKVVDAIRTVHKYNYYFSGWDLKKIVSVKKSKILSENETIFSERELEITQLIIEGYTNKEISEKLFISIRTVEKHRDNMLRKTNSRNMIQLTAYVIQHHLIEIKYEKK